VPNVVLRLVTLDLLFWRDSFSWYDQ